MIKRLPLTALLVAAALTAGCGASSLVDSHSLFAAADAPAARVYFMRGPALAVNTFYGRTVDVGLNGPVWVDLGGERLLSAATGSYTCARLKPGRATVAVTCWDSRGWGRMKSDVSVESSNEFDFEAGCTYAIMLATVETKEGRVLSEHEVVPVRLPMPLAASVAAPLKAVDNARRRPLSPDRYARSVRSLPAADRAAQAVIDWECIERQGAPGGSALSRWAGEAVRKELNVAAVALDGYLMKELDDARVLVLRARVGRAQMTAAPLVHPKDDPEARAAQVERGDAEHALSVKVLDRALKLAPASAEAHYWKARLSGTKSPVVRAGRMEMAHRDLGQAIRLARRAVELAPKEARYREALALFLIDDGRSGQAMAVMKEVAAGRNAAYALLRDMETLPMPAGAVSLPQKAEAFARAAAESGRFEGLAAPAFRVRAFRLSMTAAEAQAVYSERWPGFRFVELDRPEMAEGGPDLTPYAQFLLLRKDIMEPLDGKAELTKVLRAKGRLEEGILLSLQEVRGAAKELREEYSVTDEKPFCVLSVANFRKTY